MKPILFNTEMVQAILDGRKTVTRRVVKPQHLLVLNSPYHHKHPETPDKVLIERLCEPPYHPGDILYVRETWAPMYPDETSKIVCGYMYKADDCGLRGEVYQKWYDAKYPNGNDWCWLGKWRPSIHMPKEGARIFLRVTDVRVERLQEITDKQAMEEGIGAYWILGTGENGYAVSSGSKTLYEGPIGAFSALWNTTIKPADLPLYGWEANPWVFVIEFERCEKPEEARHEKV